MPILLLRLAIEDLVEHMPNRGMFVADITAQSVPLGSASPDNTHIKPGEMEAVMAEIRRLATSHRIHPLVAGQVMRVG